MNWKYLIEQPAYAAHSCLCPYYCIAHVLPPLTNHSSSINRPYYNILSTIHSFFRTAHDCRGTTFMDPAGHHLWSRSAGGSGVLHVCGRRDLPSRFANSDLAALDESQVAVDYSGRGLFQQC